MTFGSSRPSGALSDQALLIEGDFRGTLVCDSDGENCLQPGVG